MHDGVHLDLTPSSTQGEIWLHASESSQELEPAGYELVMVEWHDAWFDFDQRDPDAERDDYVVHTVGYLIARDARFVHIAQEILPDDDGFRAVTHIPLAIVESIKYLEVRGA